MSCLGLCLAALLVACRPVNGGFGGQGSEQQGPDTRLRLSTIPASIQPYTLCENRGTLVPAQRPIQLSQDGQVGDRVAVITWGKMGSDWTLVKPLDDLADSHLVSDIGSIYSVGSAILDSSFSEDQINSLIFGSHWPSASEFLWVRTNDLQGRREIADLPLEEDYVLSHKRVEFRQCPFYRAQSNQRLVPIQRDPARIDYRTIGFFDETNPTYLPVDLGNDQVALASDLCTTNPASTANVNTSIVYEGNDYDPTADPYVWVDDVERFRIAPGEHTVDECTPPDLNGLDYEVSDEGKLIGQLLATLPPEARVVLEPYWLQFAGSLARELDAEGVDIRVLSRPTWKIRRAGGVIASAPVKVPISDSVNRAFARLDQPGAKHEDFVDRTIEVLNRASKALADDASQVNPPFFYFLAGRKDSGFSTSPSRNYRITFFDARRPIKKWVGRYSVFVVADRERADNAEDYMVRHYREFDVRYTLSLMHSRLREAEGNRTSTDGRPLLSKTDARKILLARQVGAFLSEGAMLDFLAALETTLEQHPDGRCYTLDWTYSEWASNSRPVISFWYVPRESCRPLQS